MWALFKLFLFFALMAGVAFAASLVLMSDAVPIADSEQPQVYFKLAFLLRSIGPGGMALLVVSDLSIWFGKQFAMSRPRWATTPPAAVV